MISLVAAFQVSAWPLLVRPDFAWMPRTADWTATEGRIGGTTRYARPYVSRLLSPPSLFPFKVHFAIAHAIIILYR